MGDFIRSLGAMRSIRAHYPDAKITLLTGPAFVAFAKQSGYFDEIITETRSNWNLAEWYRVCKKTISDRPYAFIFDLQASKRTAVKYFAAARLLSRHPLRWRWLRAEVVCRDVEAAPRFWPGRVTEYTEPYPFSIETTDLSFCKGEQRHFSLLPEKFVLLIPGCSPKHPYKRWPAEFFGEVARRLAGNGISCVVLGTKDEADSIGIIERMEPSVVNFMNKASLLDIPALAARALATVGNDTGPIHIASFCRRPIFVLFCERTKRSMQDFKEQQTFLGKTIGEITVDEVWQALSQVLKLPRT